MISTALQPMVQLALQDAAKRSGRDAAALQVLVAETVTWPDGSAGCPQPGRMYTQALVPGYRIRILAGTETLDYHGVKEGPPALCPADRVGRALPDTRS